MGSRKHQRYVLDSKQLKIKLAITSNSNLCLMTNHRQTTSRFLRNKVLVLLRRSFSHFSLSTVITPGKVFPICKTGLLTLFSNVRPVYLVPLSQP